MSEKRYVILEHNWNGIHYDLMLEENSVLKTWRLAEMLKPGVQVGEALADHRLEYLEYEGPVTGDRGMVRRVEKGNFDVLESESSQSVMRMRGTLSGKLELTHQQEKTWRITWTPGS